VWEFIRAVLDQHGLVAAVLLAVLGAAGYAIYELWTKTHQALKRVDEVRVEEQKKHSKDRAELLSQIDYLKSQLHNNLLDYSTKLDALHEKRTQESQALVREAVTHISSTRGAVEKITDTMQVLREIITRRE
jgi:hypothetical protein